MIDGASTIFGVCREIHSKAGLRRAGTTDMRLSVELLLAAPSPPAPLPRGERGVRSCSFVERGARSSPSPLGGEGLGRGVAFYDYCCAFTASAICFAASFADIDGVFTNSVITSIMAPRYFCSTVMLCAIERTSVPALIESCRSFWLFCWHG